MIKIQNYYSEDPGKVPSQESLEVGQLWINIKDKKIGTKDSQNAIQQWSQFDPAEKQQALNSIPKTGDVSGITMSQTAKTSTGATISIDNNSETTLLHTLTAEPTTVNISKTTGFKATQLVLSKPKGVTTQLSWTGVDHWLSTSGEPVFGSSTDAQELSIAVFTSPTSVAVNVIYNTESPFDSDAAEAKWGAITGNIADQADLQSALSLKANAADIPDVTDALTKTEASSMFLGISAKAASATSADTATKATQDASGNTITATYATKSELAQKQPIGSYVNKIDYDAFVNQYSADKDTFALAEDMTKQLAAKANTATVTEQLAAKANLQHTHTIANVTGLQSALDAKAATTALDAKLDKSTYNADKATFALKSDISTVYKYKGSVTNINALPASDKQVGDVYNLEDTGDNVAWNGKAWDFLGGTANLSAYAKTSDVDSSIAAAKAELNAEIGKEATARQQAITKLDSAKISAKAVAPTDPMYVDYANASNHVAGGYGLKDTNYGQSGGSISGGFSVSDSTTNTTSALGIAVNTDGSGETGMYFSNAKGEATNVRVLYDKVVFTQKNVQTNLSDLAKTADVNAALSKKLDATANAASATKATQDASGNVITSTYATKTELSKKLDTSAAFTKATADTLYLGKTAKAASASTADTATSATSATSATKATQDASGNVITTTYATKTELSKKLDTSAAFTKTTADGLYLGKTAKAASATAADSATKATQDASGNVITTTYATKSELTSGLAGKQPTGNYATTAAVNAKISLSGNRGTLSGYEASASGTTVNQDSPDSQYTGSNVTVQAGASGTTWTKVVKMSAGTASFSGTWFWVGGSAPTFKYPGLLVCHWNNDQGLINYIAGAS